MVNLPLVGSVFAQFPVEVAVVEKGQICLLLAALPQSDGKWFWRAVLHCGTKVQLQRRFTALEEKILGHRLLRHIADVNRGNDAILMPQGGMSLRFDFPVWPENLRLPADALNLASPPAAQVHDMTGIVLKYAAQRAQRLPPVETKRRQVVAPTHLSADMKQRPQPPCLNEILRQLEALVEALDKTDHERHIVRLGSLTHTVAGLNGRRHWFFAQDVFARTRRLNDLFFMQIYWRSDQNRIDIGFRQKFAIVIVAIEIAVVLGHEVQRPLIRVHQRRDCTFLKQAQNGGIHRLRAREPAAGYSELDFVFHSPLPLLITL